MVVGGKVHHPGLGLARELLVYADIAVRQESVFTAQKYTLPDARRGVAHRGRRSLGVDLGEGGLKHLEGVVIKAQPDVQAVLFDALVRPAPTTGSLAAKPPAHLIKRDLVALLPVGLAGDLPGRSDGAYTAAQDGDFLSAGHGVVFQIAVQGPMVKSKLIQNAKATGIAPAGKPSSALIGWLAKSLMSSSYFCA